MEELIQQVTEKTGINADQARGAVETVINYLKQKLPGPLAGQIDGALSGGTAGAAGGLGGLMGGMGGEGGANG